MKRHPIRPWAVLFWLLAWQGAAMALAAAFPHGELLLASPVSVLVRLASLAGTGAFWAAVGRSAAAILGALCSPACWPSRWRLSPPGSGRWGSFSRRWWRR